MGLRSYLFVPANNQKMITKALTSDADALILDLEDAVAISEKEVARKQLQQALLETELVKPIYIRLNSLDTPFWQADLEVAIKLGITGVMVPKSEAAQDIKRICEVIRQHVTTFDVLPLIESAKGIENIYEIVKADKLISRVAFGSIDFALDVDCQLTPGGLELLYARSKMVIASKSAHLLSPIDAVYPQFNNTEGFHQEAKFARQIGFKAKMIIHPKQIELTHAVFSPSEAEIKKAQKIVSLFEEAEKVGKASISVDNQMVDYPVYKNAKQLLALQS